VFAEIGAGEDVSALRSKFLGAGNELEIQIKRNDELGFENMKDLFIQHVDLAIRERGTAERILIFHIHIELVGDQAKADV
jgi:hypothetical protein